ncbi:NAD-dependent epimerase/dehydratase family protein [Catalinimonas niigatensis]|uniref:NAD-dependent epimerase/dehydratase family protein n=1 Tax=Catalinimonas niigatensis TaxID=1397264 RepID=UPI00266599CC|nr:NAD-dependent epimerase/dehydratase family protein [Catalinimonas niigatensis]WPP53165.1 NAD-dependent epimerase/dehydratase family protein [Catalinimonas niigatensis]
MVLVTGATGLIGSYICRKLIASGYVIKALKREYSDLKLVQDIQHQITWINGDLLHLSEMSEYLQGIRQVIHCAAVVSYASKDEELMQQVNVESTANLINASIKHQVDCFLHISSVAAIGKDKLSNLSTEETQWTDGEKTTAYARSKHQSELEVWRGWAEGLNTVIINPSLVLGPGDWKKSSTQIFKYVWEENSFYTEGIVNYVDVRDVAEIVLRLLQSGIRGERFIVNAGSKSYQKLFEAIAREFGKKPPHIKVKGLMIKLAIILDKIRSRLTGSAPMVTDELEQVSKNQHTYDNTKIKQATQMEFTDFKDTLHWCCQQLQQDTYA